MNEIPEEYQEYTEFPREKPLFSRTFALWGWLAVAAIGIIVPTPMWIVAATPFLVLSVRTVWMKKATRRMVPIIVLGCSLVTFRLLGFLLILHLMHAQPWQLQHEEDIFSRFRLIGVFAWPDVGALEAEARHRRIIAEKALRESSPTADPFTGEPFRTMQSGEKYSIGPDMVDDAGSLRYDPTNGTFSRGDILRDDSQ